MVTYKALVATLAAMVVAIVGFVTKDFYTRLVTIQKDLVDMQVQLASIQASLVSRAEMREMVSDEVARQLARAGRTP